ncbi:MAG: EI24 domain-containing protein [Chlorobi bacterium]|nr:EI24 domain-containing protein [Chlorobiota bacterium]MCI0715990.1 EI24 domain-containing protein [Chlorobiota bacterium]
MNDFLLGFTYPFRSLKFFFAHPKLLAYSITPMLINLIIYGGIFILSYSWLINNIEKWLGADQTDAGFWLEALHVVLLVLSFVLLLFICYLLFVVLGGLITAPFNEEISQRVEEIVTKGTIQHKTGFWEDAYVSIKGEAEKIVFYLVILFLIFLLNFVPLVGNVFSAVIATIFSFFYNALDFLDYPMTRKKMKFKEKLKVTRSGKLVTYGFGCTAFLLMFLPIVNVFMKPILVVAGTSLYYEKNYHLQS